MRDVLTSRSRKEALYNIIVFFIFLTIFTFFLRYLWNNVLVKYVTVFKPVDSLLHTFLLSLAITMFKL